MAAAKYILSEEFKRENEREKRDREFWIIAFGGESSVERDSLLEDAITESALGHGHN